MTQQTLFADTDWDAQAEAFDAANPQVMALFIQEAMRLKRSGCNHGGAKMIYERLRWLHTLHPTHGEFKLNNNYTSWYAREAMEREPRLKGFFRVKGGKK